MALLELLDRLYLIAVALFAAASVWIIRRSRRGTGSSNRVPVAGMPTAVVASIVSAGLVAIVVLALVLAQRALVTALGGYAYGDSAAPPPPPIDPATQVLAFLNVLFWLLAVPFVAFLAVLDFYARRPPRPEELTRVSNRRAVGGTLLSVSLLGVTILSAVALDNVIATAAAQSGREGSAALVREVETRSVGLSMVVTVADMRLGTPTQGGRIVSYLALDITVRSATEIDLRDTAGGGANQALELYPAYAPDASYTPPLDLEWAEIPAHIPAGFEATYRIDVPVSGTMPAGQMQPDPVTTGEWEARLALYDRSPGPTFVTSMGAGTPWYEASTTFTIPDKP